MNEKEKDLQASRTIAALAALALALAACSSAPAATPAPAAAATRSAAPATAAPTTAPTPVPATPAPTAAAPAAVVYKADLKASNQNPPIQGAEATCAGSATITVTGAQAKFDVTVTGCPATAVINIAHIHEGAAGVNGGVKVNTTLTAGQLTLTGGGATLSRTVPIDLAQAAAIAANPAGFYFNMHSAANANGVIRGQLTKG